MRAQDDKLWDLIKGLGAVVGLLLVGWMSWVSYTLVNIQIELQDLNDRVPQKVKTSFIKPAGKYPLLADPTIPFLKDYEEKKR